MSLELTPFSGVSAGWQLADELTVDDLPRLRSLLTEANTLLTLDLDACFIEDGRAMAGMTALLAEVLRSGRALTLESPPQLLIHNLYRIGMYPHPHLSVQDMREEEAYG